MINDKFTVHLPVLKKEVLEYLAPKPNENFVDATFGLGGHSLSILELTKPNGKILGIEWDTELYQIVRNKLNEELPERIILMNDSYTNLENIIRKENFQPIHGILFDLGISNWHIGNSKRGFSFRRNEFLDMRYNPEHQETTAYEIINFYPEREIERILREFGEEIFAKRIAREIIKQREKSPIKTTFDLVGIIKGSVPFWYKKRQIHYATKTFQALRIAVNQELANIQTGLEQSLRVIAKDGRIVVISFHSLEDRIVKNFFREKAREKKIEILTKKPICPSKEELLNNPKSRSAKLRAAKLI